MGEEQLCRTKGLAKQIGEKLEWKLRCASGPEGLAVGNYSVAHGALHGNFEGVCGGHGVEDGEEFGFGLTGSCSRTLWSG